MITLDILVIAAQIAIPILLIAGIYQVRKNLSKIEGEDFQHIEIEFVDEEPKIESRIQGSQPHNANISRATGNEKSIEKTTTNDTATVNKKLSPLELALSDVPMPDADVPAAATKTQAKAKILDNYIDDFFTPAVDMPPPKIAKKRKTAEQNDSDIIELNHGRHIDQIKPRYK